MKKLSTYLQIFQSRLYHQFFTDELFKLLSLDQFLCADEKDERAVGRSQHTVNLVDADVAVFCCFSGGQRHFRMNRTLDMLKFKCWYYEQAIKDGSEDRLKALIPDRLPGEIRKAYENAHC